MCIRDRRYTTEEASQVRNESGQFISATYSVDEEGNATGLDEVADTENEYGDYDAYYIRFKGNDEIIVLDKYDQEGRKYTYGVRETLGEDNKGRYEQVLAQVTTQVTAEEPEEGEVAGDGQDSSTTPVSYTHLDVYKRQGLRDAVPYTGFPFCVRKHCIEKKRLHRSSFGACRISGVCGNTAIRLLRRGGWRCLLFENLTGIRHRGWHHFPGADSGLPCRAGRGAQCPQQAAVSGHAVFLPGRNQAEIYCTGSFAAWVFAEAYMDKQQVVWGSGGIE